MTMTKEQEDNLGIDLSVDKPCDCGSWMIAQGIFWTDLMLWICRGCGKKEKSEKYTTQK